ncbi:hypothetical protein GQ457_06G040070 [Hibiscus cannabinus]
MLLQPPSYDAVQFMAFSCPRNFSHPREGIASDNSNTPNRCKNSLITFLILLASAPSQSALGPKYLFPPTILKAML